MIGYGALTLSAMNAKRLQWRGEM